MSFNPDQDISGSGAVQSNFLYRAVSWLNTAFLVVSAVFVVLMMIHESGTGKRHRLEQMFRHKLEQNLRHRGGTGAHSATGRDNDKKQMPPETPKSFRKPAKKKLEKTAGGGGFWGP